MRLSFPCPHCRQLVEADSRRIGAMAICANCLVAFPVPQVQTSATPTASDPSESEVDIALQRPGLDPRWGLVIVGLTVVELSMKVLLVAGLAGFATVLVASIDPFFSGPLLSADRPLLILTLFVALA